MEGEESQRTVRAVGHSGYGTSTVGKSKERKDHFIEERPFGYTVLIGYSVVV